MRKSLHSADYRHFLTELRAVREGVDVTQEQLAKALGEHQTFISKVENGIRRLDVVELRQWLAALGVQLADFAASLDDRLGRNTLPRSSKVRR